MMSDHEREILRNIEARLSAEEPVVEFGQAHARPRRERIAHDLVIALSLLAGVLCDVVGVPGAGLVAEVFALVVLMLRQRRFPSPRRSKLPRPVREWT